MKPSKYNEPPIDISTINHSKVKTLSAYASKVLSDNKECFVAQWARTNYDKKADIQVKGVDRLIVGHSPTGSGEVEVHGNTVYADLGSFFRDKVSFIQLM